MKKIKNIYWFTFVELIIVVVILWILSTIWFMSYVWHISKSRDSNRITQVSSIYGAMESYRTKWYLPIPENKVSIYSSGELIWYQWYATQEILNMVWYQEWWKDPEDNKYFTYFLNSKQRNLWILAMLENNVIEWWTQEFARVPVSYWDKVWIILDKENNPIQDNTQLQTIWLDVKTATWQYSAYFSDKERITWTGDILQVMYGTVLTWIIWETCEEYVEANAWYLLKPWYYLIKDNSKLTKIYCAMSNNCKGWIPTNALSNAISSSWATWHYSTVWWECTYLCNVWYDWDGNSCEISTCNWSIPLWAISNAVSTVWWTRNYSISQWLCTYKCNVWYSRVWSVCQANVYTITYDWNWGWGHIPWTNPVTYNNQIWTLPTTDPTRLWYIFNWWFTSSSGGSQVLITDIYTKVWDSTYFAQWLPNYCDFAWLDIFGWCIFWP